MEKKCCNCDHAMKDYGEWTGRTIYRCFLMKDARGNYKEVSKDGSCNNYSPINTPGNMGYKEPGGGGCFLTSACVEYLGKPDDCEELTLLRKFRDEKLKPTESGAILVEEYYQIAPLIVEKINSSDNKEEIYEEIYKAICRCVALIKEYRYDEVTQEYKNLVLDMKRRFLED